MAESIAPQIDTAPSVRVAVLAVATEWNPHHGGLSSLNRNLCIALARAGHRVVCLVPTVSQEESETARKYNVDLVEATSTRGKDVGPLACLHRRPVLPKNFTPDLVIGHGRVTGFAAQTLVDDFFPRALRVHLLHTIPSEIEWYKLRSSDAAVRAEGDERAEIELGRTAALAVGVGPRLAAELENMLAPFELPRAIHQMNPGIDRLIDLPADSRAPRTPPRGMHCLFLGRAEDETLKGLDIAAEAIARLRARGREAVLVVRGAQPGTGQKLQEQLIARVKAPNSVRVKEFSPDAQTIREDLLRSTIVLMPSRSEGFGLVGLEAIECGVPTLVSDQSGLAQLLRSRGLPEMIGQRVVVPVTTDVDASAEEWARRIDAELHDPPAAFRRAEEVRSTLAACFSWDQAATGLIAAINVQPAAERDSETIRFLLEKIYELAPELQQQIATRLNPDLLDRVAGLTAQLDSVTTELTKTASSSKSTIQELEEQRAQLTSELEVARKQSIGAQTALALAAMRDANWLQFIRSTLMPKQPGRVPFHNDAEVAIRGYRCSNLVSRQPVLVKVTWSKLAYNEGGLHRGYRAGLIFHGHGFAPGITIASRSIGDTAPPPGRKDYWYHQPNIYFGDYLEISTNDDELESPLGDRDLEYKVRNPNGKESDWVRFSYEFDDAKLMQVLEESERRGRELMALGKFGEAVEPLRKAWVFSRHLPITPERRSENERIWNEAIDKDRLSQLRFREGARLRILSGDHQGKIGTVHQLALRHVHAYFIDIEGANERIAAADNQVEMADGVTRDEYETMLLRFLEQHPGEYFDDSSIVDSRVPGLEALSVEDIRALLRRLAAVGQIDRVVGEATSTKYCHKKA